MQADVLPLFTFDMDGDFSLNPLLFMVFGSAIFHGSNLRGGAQNVVAGSGRHPLGKFATVIREKLPMRALLSHGAHPYLDSIKGAVIWPVCSAEDKSVVLFELLILTGK